jgi:hypothetical protein
MSKTEYFLDGIYEPLNETVKEKADAIKKYSQEKKTLSTENNNWKRGEFIRIFNEKHKNCQITYPYIYGKILIQTAIKLILKI